MFPGSCVDFGRFLLLVGRNLRVRFTRREVGVNSDREKLLARVEELSKIEKGWLYDGHPDTEGLGEPIDPLSLQTMKTVLYAAFETGILSYEGGLFPTPEGGVQFEFSTKFNKRVVTLKFSPIEKTIWFDDLAYDKAPSGRRDLGYISYIIEARHIAQFLDYGYIPYGARPAEEFDTPEGP